MTKIIFKIDGQEVVETESRWETTIRKPIYGTCVALNEKLLKSAISKRKKILVKCPGAEELIDPKEWMKDAKRISKVFKQPNNPMILYQKSIGVTISEDNDEEEK